MSEKRRFIIVGSGWRSLYYVRVAKALPEKFELCAMLCRTEEKAVTMSKEYGIHTTTSIAECEEYNPDFVVVVVNKTSILDVSKEWMRKGFTVLCETPPTLDVNELNELWRLKIEEGYKLCVAEQYIQYPTYGSMIKTLDSGIIGDTYCINMSLAHDYHGASLLRRMLGVTGEQFTITGKRYTFDVTETANRYERFTDGHTAKKNRDIFTIEFNNGKVAYYDFCSEQYRSFIRDNYVKVQGVKGELTGSVSGDIGDGIVAYVSYINNENIPDKKKIESKTRYIIKGDKNPSLNEVTEITDVTFGGKRLYEARFGACGLAEDETAIAVMMEGAATYNEGGQEIYPLECALQDAYMASLMQKAVDTPGEAIKSEIQSWN